MSSSHACMLVPFDEHIQAGISILLLCRERIRSHWVATTKTARLMTIRGPFTLVYPRHPSTLRTGFVGTLGLWCLHLCQHSRAFDEDESCAATSHSSGLEKVRLASLTSHDSRMRSFRCDHFQTRELRYLLLWSHNSRGTSASVSHEPFSFGRRNVPATRRRVLKQDPFPGSHRMPLPVSRL
jgi:hypothetical protein